MRPTRILLRLKRKNSRTVKAFANVRDSRQPHPKQLHLGYFGIGEDLDAVKDDLFHSLLEKWPRKLKPREIDWADAQMKLAKLRLTLDTHKAERPELGAPSGKELSEFTNASEGCSKLGPSIKDSTPESAVAATSTNDVTTATLAGAFRAQSDVILAPAPDEPMDLRRFLSSPDTLRFLTRLATSWSNNSDANDLVQTTMVRALDASRYPEPGTNLRAWLVRIMRNIHIDNLRHRARQSDREITVNLDEFGISTLPKEVEEPWKDLSFDELLTVVGQLPVNLQIIIELYLEKHTYREIADVLGISTSTALYRLRQALTLLRRLIERQLAWRPG